MLFYIKFPNDSRIFRKTTISFFETKFLNKEQLKILYIDSTNDFFKNINYLYRSLKRKLPYLFIFNLNQIG